MCRALYGKARAIVSCPDFVLKGDIVWARYPDELKCFPDGYLIVKGGVTQGVFNDIPWEYRDYPLIDYTGMLVVPGLNDIHLHAPQYNFRGIGMDLELLDWLNSHAFPEETKFADLDYAKRSYKNFVRNLRRSYTTRATIFATMHMDATLELMDLLETSRLKTMVGKVSMDRNSPDYLREQDAQTSLKETVRWLNAVNERNYLNTQPILTPRFTPSCTDELMKGLGNLRHDWQLPLQSHLSENLSEIDWVKELCPWSSCYGETYEHFGELAGEEPVIMAHCNWSSDEEIEILKRNDVTIAHCPQSNAQLASGIAPIRRYLNEDMQVGLGTDIAGGASLNMFRACADAVMVSKLRWRMVDQDLSPLTTTEAFYLATQGGGQVYGKVGSFDWGYDADILVLDDSALATPLELTLSQRFERYMYLADEGGHLVDKFVAGQRIDLS